MGTVSLAVLLAIDGLLRVWRGAASGRYTERLQQAATVAIVITAAGGLGLVAAGARPRDALHFVYAAVVFAALPTVTALARGASARGRAIAAAGAAIVILVILARLYQTG